MPTAKKKSKSTPKKSESTKNVDHAQMLKGWREIAEYLGQPVSVAERWAQEGMPIEHKGRSVIASQEDLRQWLGRESAGEPLQIASDETDLSAELKRGLAYVRQAGKKKSDERK
jgi:hypothetical protein